MKLTAGEAPATEIGWALPAAAALVAVFVALTMRLDYPQELTGRGGVGCSHDSGDGSGGRTPCLDLGT